MNYNLTQEEEFLLYLSRADLDREAGKDIEGLPFKPSNSVDHQKILDLAGLNEVTPLIYRHIKKFPHIPGYFLDSAGKSYFATVKSNMYHSREVLKILRSLQEAGVEAISLKGSLFSDIVLGDMGVYPTGDIDFLVRERDLDRAKDTIAELGYSASSTLTEEDQKWEGYHLRLGNGKYVVELHWNLVMRYFDASPDFWWEDAGLIEYEGMKLSMLSPERYLLYSIFRLFSHGFIPLRFAVLVSGILRKYRQQIDWNKFFSSARELKMNRVSLFTLKLLHELLAVGIPQGIVSRRVYGYDFLKGIVMRGLFKGVKRARLRMAFFTILMDTPFSTSRVLIRRLLPAFSEIRLRYGLPAKSRTVYLYYLLNPILLATRKQEQTVNSK